MKTERSIGLRMHKPQLAKDPAEGSRGVIERELKRDAGRRRKAKASLKKAKKS